MQSAFACRIRQSKLNRTHDWIDSTLAQNEPGGLGRMRLTTQEVRCGLILMRPCTVHATLQEQCVQHDT